MLESAQYVSFISSLALPRNIKKIKKDVSFALISTLYRRNHKKILNILIMFEKH